MHSGQREGKRPPPLHAVTQDYSNSIRTRPCVQQQHSKCFSPGQQPKAGWGGKGECDLDNPLAAIGTMCPWIQMKNAWTSCCFEQTRWNICTKGVVSLMAGARTYVVVSPWPSRPTKEAPRGCRQSALPHAAHAPQQPPSHSQNSILSHAHQKASHCIFLGAPAPPPTAPATQCRYPVQVPSAGAQNHCQASSSAHGLMICINVPHPAQCSQCSAPPPRGARRCRQAACCSLLRPPAC